MQYEGMSPRERALRDERARVWDGVKGVLERWNAGEHDLSVEERLAVDQANTRLSEIEKDLELVRGAQRSEAAKDEGAETRGVTRDQAEDADERYAKAFGKYLRRGERGLTSDERGMLMESRALSTSQIDADAAGFLIPQGFWHNLQVAMKAYGGLLPYCREVRTATGNPMPWPTNDPTAVVGAYLSENTTIGTQDYVFGQGMLNAWTIVSGVTLASIQLVNDSAFDVEQFVTERTGEAIGRKVAAELHSGSGTSALLGVETALTTRGAQASPALGGLFKSGRATSWAATAGGNAYAYQFGTTATAKLANKLIGFDDIIGMIETVDPAYRDDAVFVCNDVTMAMLRTITDAYGHPLWNPDPRQGGVDNFYGKTVVIDQNTSGVSSSASTAGGLLFGSFSHAMVVRIVDQAGFLALHERYADALQVGYIAYVRMDARSNDLRAAALYSTNAT
jgi:HK97 family phage major capsid protein